MSLLKGRNRFKCTVLCCNVVEVRSCWKSFRSRRSRSARSSNIQVRRYCTSNSAMLHYTTGTVLLYLLIITTTNQLTKIAHLNFTVTSGLFLFWLMISSTVCINPVAVFRYLLYISSSSSEPRQADSIAWSTCYSRHVRNDIQYSLKKTHFGK